MSSSSRIITRSFEDDDEEREEVYEPPPKRGKLFHNVVRAQQRRRRRMMMEEQQKESTLLLQDKNHDSDENHDKVDVRESAAISFSYVSVGSPLLFPSLNDDCSGSDPVVSSSEYSGDVSSSASFSSYGTTAEVTYNTTSSYPSSPTISCNDEGEGDEDSEQASSCCVAECSLYLPASSNDSASMCSHCTTASSSSHSHCSFFSEAEEVMAVSASCLPEDCVGVPDSWSPPPSQPLQLSWADLPEDLQCRVLTFLDAPDLLRARQVSRQWHAAAANDTVWQHLLLTLWKDKAHIPTAALSLGQQSCEGRVKQFPSSVSIRTPTPSHESVGLFPEESDQDSTFSGSSSYHSLTLENTGGWMAAYRYSLRDAVERHSMAEEEFCFDAETMTGTVWSFRFKEAAGQDWTAADPWYNGQPSRKMVFLRNGKIQQFIADTSLSKSELEEADENSGILSLTDLLMRKHRHHSGVLIDPPMSMSWRFLTRPMDLPTRPVGSYVRISVAGRDVPTYAVRRSPVGNWGFVMESCWGLYASFELPHRHPVNNNNDRSDATLRTISPRRSQLVYNPSFLLPSAVDEANLPQRIVPPVAPLVAQEEPRLRSFRFRRQQHLQQQAQQQSLEEYWLQQQEQDEQSARNNSFDSLADDASLLITNAVQWREAFLYNVGVRVLPEGDEATHEFDRAWGGL